MSTPATLHQLDAMTAEVLPVRSVLSAFLPLLNPGEVALPECPTDDLPGMSSLDAPLRDAVNDAAEKICLKILI